MADTPIRNFCIIAHIDHGKSTLADRILELCEAVTAREQKAQFLDSMELERERGITIKAQAVRLRYHDSKGQEWRVNLIDTPGHVDFAYEVSRSLAACDGAMLVVDATQGVEAQTVANVYLALDNNLEIVPVINKIDLPSSDVEETRRQIEEVIGLDATKAVAVSAKTGEGVREAFEQVLQCIPAPPRDLEAPLQALLFDSWFDAYRGVVVLARVLTGRIKKGMKISLMRTGGVHEVQEVGAYTPFATPLEELGAGEVGFVIAGIKDIHETQIGDTITEPSRPCAAPLPGFKEAKPMVFAGIFPTEAKDYVDVKEALDKLRLNDCSFTFEPETSQALGFGFRCGFLGLLHMEIIQERLEREYDLSLVTTAPTVVYRVTTLKGELILIDNPAKLPPVQNIASFTEPLIRAHVHAPTEHLGSIITLCEERRGRQIDLSYSGHNRALVVYELPLSEVVFDFYDRLKSLSRGYASWDYEITGYQDADLVRLDILLNGEIVDALSVIVHRERAFERGQSLCRKLKDIIPRQQFEVAIQAALGNKVIARTTVKAYRKNVTAKCYGGDITRKRKLLERQKEGKKRMKSVGSVDIPQEAFLAVLRTD